MCNNITILGFLILGLLGKFSPPDTIKNKPTVAVKLNTEIR